MFHNILIIYHYARDDELIPFIFIAPLLVKEESVHPNRKGDYLWHFNDF